MIRILSTALGLFAAYLVNQKRLLRSRYDTAILGADLTNKVVLITGANTGLGKQTAQMLLELGAHVIIACRNVTKAEAAVEEIKAAALLGPHSKASSGKIEIIKLDLASLQSVRECAKEFLDRGLPLDVLINNAGIAFSAYKETADGFEQTFGVNHLGHFLLTLLLLPAISKAPSPRIVNLSSLAHKPGYVNFDDIDSKRLFQHRPTCLASPQAYSNSKLMNILFTLELQRRLDRRRSRPDGSRHITVNALHPGSIVYTELTRNLPRPIFALATPLRAILKDLRDGALTSVYAAASPSLDGVGAKYLDLCAISAECESLPYAHLAPDLWDRSCILAGVPRDLLS